MSHSALELARKAGWDDSIKNIETKVKTAIAALENAGYVERLQNSPKIFANSICSKNAQEAINIINVSSHFDDSQKVNATRIIKSLISSKSISKATHDETASRIDYISDRLGISIEEVTDIVNKLKENNILAQEKDLTAFIKKEDKINRSMRTINTEIFKIWY